MPLTGAPFPYNIENLLGGAVRILYGKAAGAGAADVPVKLQDVFDQEAPYAAKADWTDLGATKESFTYSKGFDTEGWEIQQYAGNVIEEITDISRSIEISYADLRPEHLQMIEGAPSVETIAATAAATPAGSRGGSQKKVSFGGFTSLDRYRFVFVSRRPKAAGIVTESNGTTERGRFFAGVAYSAQIAADEFSFEQAKGELTAVGVTWTLFPEAGEPAGQEVGTWLDEDAGAIVA